MSTFNSKAIAKLAGVRGVKLMRLCNDLGIGSTTKGAPREIDLDELMRLMLAIRLMNVHGQRREDAICIAQAVEFKDWAEIIAEEKQLWLFARRALDANNVWMAIIVDSEGALKLLREAQPDWIVVGLYAIAREAIIDEATAMGAGQSKAKAKARAEAKVKVPA